MTDEWTNKRRNTTSADLFGDDKSEWPEDENDVSHAMVFKVTRRQPNLKPAEIFRQIC